MYIFVFEGLIYIFVNGYIYMDYNFSCDHFQLPFTTMLALLCMWFGISVPLVFLGYFFGYRKQVCVHSHSNGVCVALSVTYLQNVEN